MKLLRRRGVALLAMLSFAGCTYWRPQPIGPRDVLADPEISQVRLTMTNGEQVVARVAEVRGDSIYGTRGETGPLTCERASALCNLQLPISDIGFVEAKRFSAIKTAAMVLVPVGVFVVVFLVGDSCPSGPSAGPC